jgi:hypothetical protein
VATGPPGELRALKDLTATLRLQLKLGQHLQPESAPSTGSTKKRIEKSLRSFAMSCVAVWSSMSGRRRHRS